MHLCIWDSLCPCHLWIFMFLVAICGCLCVMLYIFDKKWRVYWKIFLFYYVSPFLTTLIWICGRQELCKCLLFTSVKWYLDNTRPGEQDYVREYRTNTSHNITFREMNVSSLLFYLTWLFMVISSMRRWSQRGYLLISVPGRTAILFRLIILLLKHPMNSKHMYCDFNAISIRLTSVYLIWLIYF